MDCDHGMPEQMLFDILLWLPVVSLLRFKLVCKSWFSLIDSSTFSTQHLHHHSGKDTLIAYYSDYIAIDDSYESRLQFCVFTGNRYEECINIDFDMRWYTTVGADGGILDLADSCNGIVCLQNNWSGDVALWNPALKQLRPLPRSSISHKRYTPGDVEYQFTIIGFGFDAKADDYKVVRIKWHSHILANQVEIYNLRTSCWRIIHKDGALPFTFINDCSAHATSKDGTCFWLGRDNQNTSILISFDLKDEEFGTMALPDDKEDEKWYGLAFLNDKLAYIKGIGYGGAYHEYFEIWVLHEFGVKESWNKLYNIGPTPNLGKGLTPTGFSKNGEFLLLKTTFVSHGISGLHLYNLVTREENYPPIQEPNPWNLHFCLHFNESLVSIKSFNGGDN